MANIKNNPVIEIEAIDGVYKIQTIGDPHLGRTFRTGVSSSKFGVRESLVLEDFKKLLNPEQNLSINFIVVMGDLFDKFIVKPSVVDIAVKLIEEATEKNPEIVYFVIPGNHDLSKDKTKVSSYYLFQKIFDSKTKSETSNLHILYENSVFYPVLNSNLIFHFDAYNPFHKDTSNDDDSSFETNVKKDNILISFGHWDNPKNDFADYLPSDLVLAYSDIIVSGHIHTPEKFSKNKIKYIYTGSLQPYSHAEDPNNSYYITILYKDLEDYLEKSDKTSDKFKNLNVRVNCYPGYLISKPIECLSLTYNNVLEIPKQITENLEVIEVDNTKITDFTSLYLYKLKYEYDVDEDVILKINSFLKDSSEDVSFTLD